MRKSASRGSKIAPDFCISGRFLRLWACPALRAARFRRGSKASGGRDGACGGEKAPLFPGRMPIRGGVPGKTGRREGKRRAGVGGGRLVPSGGLLPHVSRAFSVVGGRLAPSGSPFCCAVRGGREAFARRAPVGRDGRVRLWEDAPAPGGCPFLLRREESFVDGCGDGGPGEWPRALSARGF